MKIDHSQLPNFSIRDCVFKREVEQEFSDNKLTQTQSGSEAMASNVCPVCKLFTSSSNTTLNAHIDQCLCSGESNAIRDCGELPKPRVKLTKKKLMVDIYATARHCTLEDLDRRNGTNWANNRYLVEPAKDAHDLKNKRTRFAPNASVGNIGDIYVDSNGTKLLILSKVNDSSPLVPRKKLMMKKHGKLKEERRSCLTVKRKSFKPSFSNDDPLNRRQINTVKGFNMIEETTEVDDLTEASQEINEESQSLVSNAHVQIKNSDPPTLGHWVCSKRSILSRRLGNKDVKNGSEKNIVSTWKLLFKQNYAVNSSSSSEVVFSSKTKRPDTLPNTANNMNNRKKRSPRPSCLNLKALLRSDSFHEIRHPSFATRKTPNSFSRSSSISLETRKLEKRENFMIREKLRKRRYVSGCTKWQEGEKHKNVNEGCQCIKEFSLISHKANTGQSRFSGNLENEGFVVADSTKSSATDAPTSCTTLDPIQEEQAYSTSPNEIQIKSHAQISTINQDEQSGDVISNEVSSQYIQISDDNAERAVHQRFQTDISSSQECKHCFDFNREMGLENTHSSETSVPVEYDRDDHMIVNAELSCSPVSTISAITLPFTVDDKLKVSEERLSSMTVRKDDHYQSREPSCSSSECLYQEPQFSEQRTKNADSNLFVEQCTLSSQALKSHANPILRLMGKDLVVRKEEHVQLPSNHPFDSDYSTNVNFLSYGVPNHAGFVSYNNHCHNQIHQCSMAPLYQAQDVIVIDDGPNEFKPVTEANFAVQNPNLGARQLPYVPRNLSQMQSSEGLPVFSSPSWPHLCTPIKPCDVLFKKNLE